ncbi:MAG: iron-sulfur cluster assembly accessory protein [Bdellovibrionales bacterium]|nr:iron-sulfur cluster assembly accessory protein [Bdellovibrionales bacterium]
MIQVSDIAARQIQFLKERDQLTERDFLRVSVNEGGCSGFSYKLDFDTEKKESDKTFDCKGVQIVVDSKSLLYLMGMTLNFDGGLNGKGFTFSNPNASKTCGCGFSFNV